MGMASGSGSGTSRRGCGSGRGPRATRSGSVQVAMLCYIFNFATTQGPDAI